MSHGSTSSPVSGMVSHRKFAVGINSSIAPICALIHFSFPSGSSSALIHIPRLFISSGQLSLDISLMKFDATSITLSLGVCSVGT